jgi:hypothetical protein
MHLTSNNHGQAGTRESVLQNLGYQVLGCDRQKMATNNDDFKKRLESGYIPVNSLQKYIKYAKTPKVIVPGGLGRKANSAKYKGVTDPVAGDLYSGYWGPSHKSYALMILGWDDQKVCGLQGNLYNHGFFKPQKNGKVVVPKCYTLTQNKKAIAGWAAGYEDGGPRVQQRQFPVLWFDERK